MEKFDELVKQQNIVGDEIQQIIRNYKKDPKDRKTVPYYQERLRRLEEAWARFDSNDSKLKAAEEKKEAHAYFLHNYYAEMKNAVTTYRQLFEEAIISTKGLLDPTIEEAPELPASFIAEQPMSPTGTVIQNPSYGLIRKLMAQMAALDRQLTAIENHQGEMTPQFVAVKTRTINEVWQQVDYSNMAVWEAFENPIQSGYDLEKYIDLETRVQQALISLSSKEQRINTSVINQHMSSHSIPEIPLPKVAIPKFEGDYMKWRQFHDMFTQIIHNQSLPKVQKMWYLKTNTSGEAERLIRHLAISEENYETAWMLLKDRYDNRRILVNNLVQRLLDQPQISTTAASIRELHDTTQECLQALRNLDVNVDSWDALIVPILIRKLDRHNHLMYEQFISNPKEIQQVSEILKFLEMRFHSLDAIGSKDKQKSTKALTTTVTKTCKCCNQADHPLFMCDKFKHLQIKDRINFTLKNNICINCLKYGHRAKACSVRGCTKCSSKHNTLLHRDDVKTNPAKTNQQPVSSAMKPASERENSTNNVSLMSSGSPEKSYVLLGTAIINIVNKYGQRVECRAILDSGSQVNLVTEGLVKRLHLQLQPTTLKIEGIGNGRKRSQFCVQTQIESKTSKFTAPIEAYVLPHITTKQPSQYIDTTKWFLPKGIQLADPKFNQPQEVDVLLGAEFFLHLLKPEHRDLAQNLPRLQNTVLGWIITGKLHDTSQNKAFCGIYTEKDKSMDEMLAKFWEIDEIDAENSTMSVAEQQCENHFIQTVKRTPEGRFIVKLPFAEEASTLGHSCEMATNRFLSLERRLAKSPDVRKQYVDFMEEYKSLGHMSEIKLDNSHSPHYFIPHHCVMRPESSTTKLRVVFDASAKTTSQRSLNDILLKGPTVQNTLFSILLRFRMPRFAFSTDIEKMYRQIRIHPNDRKMQLIVWRSNPTLPIKYYQLKTVTYGTRPAPYLATRCLKQLAMENQDQFPLGSRTLERDFYVDDALSGSNSLMEAREIQQQLNTILGAAGFKLRKWCANHSQLLQGIPQEDQELDLEFSDRENSTKTLGLVWTPSTDNLKIKIGIANTNIISKRSAASDLAKIYDPLGLVSPVVVRAKIFMQQLWLQKLGWDDLLSDQNQQEWTRFREDLSSLNDTSIPRHVFNKQVPKCVQLHCFSDASEKAYGAAIYIRALHQDNTISVRLLCAKSRVAPIKTHTIPRLELLAAQTGAQLTHRVRADLNFNGKIYFWTDSQIVLSWINSNSASFQTFVAHRVANIQSLTTAEQWRYVNTKDNPADILSRGLMPSELKICHMWFYGPLFLYNKESTWPIVMDKAQFILDNTERKKEKTVLATSTIITDMDNIVYTLNSRNSFARVQRIIGYILRFINKCKGQSIEDTVGTVLTPKELENSLHLIVKTIQYAEFKREMDQLNTGKGLSRTSAIVTLAPFIDSHGILRVGGRLENSSLPFDAKHPMLLPYNDTLVKLLMQEAHITNKHCGPQALVYIMKQRFWPIKGRAMARSIVQHCVRCTRAKPTLFHQVMGNLPSDRVHESRPFINSGVDFCGPVTIHYKIRGKRPTKAYIAIYCCFATKAVHLELVSDLTTDAFIGSLKRFVAKRGVCKTLYCDNATNFVGARNRLSELMEIIYEEKAQTQIAHACSNKGIKFSFIPPRAPHFGGLWEAAVKSAKHLLLRSVDAASLTFEELNTVIHEIEAILNSRPITPMSSDPNDFTALTPGHFIIGEPLTSLPTATTGKDPPKLLTRWEQVSSVKAQFWKRWHMEYLADLQQRYKWKESNTKIAVGTMVILKEDNTPPLKWPLGRIVKVHEGQDKMIRVVDVKTSAGICKRAIHRLAPLFPAEDTKPPNPMSNQSSCTPTKRDYKDPPESKSSSKKSRLSAISSLVTLLCIMSISPTVSTQLLEIMPFERHPDLYFEGQGVMKIQTAEWKIIAYYNLSPFWRDISTFSEGIVALKGLCAQLKTENTCFALIKHFRYVKDELLQQNGIFSRPKRGAIDLVGNVARTLFGVLDSSYAEEMVVHINELKENDAYLNQLLHNQTSIIDSTLNILKHDETAIKAKIESVQEHVHALRNHVDTNTQEIHLSQLLTTMSTQLTILSAELQRIQSDIIDVLTDTHHGRISPMLLSPHQLNAELINIKAHLPAGKALPFEGTNLIDLYKFITVEGTLSSDKIVFLLRIPLVELQEFNLFHIIAIPDVNKKFATIIRPSVPYVAVNMHRDEFIALSHQNFSSCITTKVSTHICTQGYARQGRHAQALSCEIQLFNNKTATNCKIEKSISDTTWIQMDTPNHWIYACNE